MYQPWNRLILLAATLAILLALGLLFASAESAGEHSDYDYPAEYGPSYGFPEGSLREVEVPGWRCIITIDRSMAVASSHCEALDNGLDPEYVEDDKNE